MTVVFSMTTFMIKLYLQFLSFVQKKNALIKHPRVECIALLRLILKAWQQELE
jgi:hypothetical protein